jgi:hypothetical protein
MKQRLKQITKFIALCALAVLASCEKDFYEDESKTNKNIVFNDISLNDEIAKNDFKLTSAVNKLKEKKKELSSRIVYDSIYDFYFDDENGKYINVDGKISYTFPVYRDSVTNKVENVVFYTNEDNEYNIALFKYNLTKEDLLNLSEEEIKDTEIHITEILTKYQGPGCGSFVVMCDNDGYGGYANSSHVAGSNCHHAGNGSHLSTVWVPSDCGGGPAEPGAPGPNGGNTGPNGGGGGIGTTPIITTPVPCVICPSQAEEVDPCTSLKNLLDPTKCNARDKIVQVKDASDSYNGEVGAVFSNINGAYSSSPIKYSPASNTNSSSDAVHLVYDENTYAATHSHPNNDTTTPMFSFSDVFELYRIYTNTNPVNIPNVTFMLTLPSTGTTFAIKVDNFEIFRDFISSIYNDPEVLKKPTEKERVKKRNEIFQEMMCRNCNPGNGPNATTNYNNRFIDGFLQTTKGKGMSLYKATNNITNWEKLNAAESGSQYPYTTTPCN